MRTRWIAISTTLLTAVALTAACGSSSAQPSSNAPAGSTGAKEPIVIGNVGTYSGPFATQYLPSLHGLEAWVSYTNAHGGINGHQVKLVSKDDNNNPATSLQAVKQLVENDHVVALVDVTAPGTDSAWAGYVQQHRIPVVGGLATDANWLQNPYFFSTNTNPVGILTGQLVLAKRLGSRVGLFLCAEESACKSAEALLPQVGKSVNIDYVGSQLVAASASDYTAQCLALKDAHADVVIPEIDQATAQRVIASCATQGFTPKIEVADITPQILANGQFDGATAVAYTPLWFGDNPLTSNWAATYKKMFPKDIANSVATLGWQAGVVFAAALTNAPAKVTSQSVLDGLWRIPPKSTFGGWTPPLTYTKGKPATTTGCLWHAGVDNHKLTAPDGYDFVCPGT